MTTRPEQAAYSQVYTSPSKQLFSFTRAPRFHRARPRGVCDQYYDPPSGSSGRAPSFGCGSRTTFQPSRDSSPSPGEYDSYSVFNNRKKGEMFSFGISREAYRKVFIKNGPTLDAAIPGPGTYDVRDVPGKRARKYSLRPKPACNCNTQQADRHRNTVLCPRSRDL